MFRKQFLLAIVVVALVTMACGVSLNLPESQVKTGPTVEDSILVPNLDTKKDIDLSLNFGAGKLKLSPGAVNGLVSGTATYNVADFKPTIKTEDNTASIDQGNLTLNGLPNFKDDIKNDWDLKLTKTQTLNLKIQAGAYTGRYDLGGVPLSSLDISDGAADVNLAFSDPNPVELGAFNYTTGASSVTLEGLGNANMDALTFRSGAGSYRLDFSGDLQRDLEVRIESGISTVTIVIPEKVNVKLTFEGGVTNIDTYGSWEKLDEKNYMQSGSGPLISLTITMGAGNLELRNH